MSTETDTPVLRETPGGWLATSHGDFPRIGVIGNTRAEAEADYRSARQQWRELLGQPEHSVASSA